MSKKAAVQESEAESNPTADEIAYQVGSLVSKTVVILGVLFAVAIAFGKASFSVHLP